MVKRVIGLVLILTLMGSCAVSKPDLQTDNKEPEGCPSVEELVKEIWNAHHAHNAQLLLDLIDYTGANIGETKKFHTKIINDRKTMNPSSVSVQPVQKAESDWFRFQGLRFNLDPVVKVRIEYQELIDTEIKKDDGGMQMQLPAILYYYAGQKNMRYFIATVVPIEAAPLNQAGSQDSTSSEDLIMVIPLDNPNAPTATADGKSIIIKELEEKEKTKKSKSENLFLTEAFWKNATLEEVKITIKNGIDLHSKTDYGESALTFAVSYNQNPDMIDLLVSHGLDVNRCDKFQETPLMGAASYNPNPAVVDRLVSIGANVSSKDMDGYTALSHAASSNPNLEMIDCLVKKGLDVRQKSKYGEPILVLAASSNPNPDVIDRLIKHGADIKQHDNDGQTPLMAAAGSNNNPAMIDCLVKFGDKIEARNEDGMTPLVCAAAFNKNPEVVERLIGHGANITAKDNDGYSVLYWAEDNDHLRGTDVLLKLRRALGQ